MKERGFILLVSLIFLFIMTMIGISMFSGVTIDEMMSGNKREKSRSLDAAQMGLEAAQDWLSNPSNSVLGGSLNPGAACTSSTAQPAICTNGLSNSVVTTPTSWPYYATFTPSGMTVNTAGGVNTYYSQPQYYVQLLGFLPSTSSEALYQVTSAAQGGNNTATAVVQAVYRVKAKAIDLGG